jgi:hypothetical protein
MPALLIRLTINLAAPVLAYVLLRPHVHSDITALVGGVAAWTRSVSSPSRASRSACFWW